MYSITTDRSLGRVNIRAWGFWDDEILRAFAADHLAAVARLGLRPGAHTILGDLTALTVQSVDIIAKAQHFFANATNKARRTALVASGAIASLQAKRMTTVRPDMRMFSDMAEAEAWLRA